MSTQQIAIAGRALLVALRISTWSARKYDKRVTDEVNARHAASRDAGRFNKLLLPGDATPYRDLVRICNAARADHYAHTLPWSDGLQLLPTAEYMHYTDMMRAHAGAFDAARAAFVAAYPAMRDDARTFLNGMYREEDYPTAGEIGQRFGMSLDFSPLPTAGDFRLDLPDREIAAIEARVADRVQAAARDAMRDAWARLGDTVARMHERLADPSGIFRDTLVENARDLVDILARLNFADDANLEAMRARVAAELTVYDPQTLRDNPDVRKATADKAAAIMQSMAAFYGAGAA